MNSFDFYDTLVARRSVIDTHLLGDDEVKNLIPIKENIDKVQPEDVIISDCDHPELVRRAVKEVCGLDNVVYATQDGKLTGAIWKTVRPDLHTGDNLHSDYNTPIQAGLKAELVKSSQVATYTETFLTNNNLGYLSSWLREARLRTCSAKYRTAELLQIELNFPLLYLASELLHREMKYYDKVLMSSRDCYLWSKLQTEFSARQYEVSYFWTSREARERCTSTYVDYVEGQVKGKTLIVDLCGTGNSLPIFLGKTKYPELPVLLLGKYDSLEHNRSECYLYIADSFMERLNVAKHSKIVDVSGSSLVFSNPANIDWNSERIRASHSAFEKCVALMDRRCELSQDKILQLMRFFADEISRRKDEVLEDDVVFRDDTA